MSGWTQDIPAHLTRPRDQGVIEAPRVEVGHGASSWERSGRDGIIPRAIRAGGAALRRDAEVTVPAHVVIQCAPSAPAGPLARVTLPEWTQDESYAAQWARKRRDGK